MSARFHPRIERCGGGGDRGELLSDLDLKGRDLLPDHRSSSERVTRQETESECVRVLDDHRFVDSEVGGLRE